jgi:hypothetical protein
MCHTAAQIFRFLAIGSTKDRQQFGRNQHFNAASDAKLPSNQPCSLRDQDYLVNQTQADAGMALQVASAGDRPSTRVESVSWTNRYEKGK